MNEKKELVVGTIISYCTVVAQILSTLILTPFLLKELGDNEYGIYKIIVSLIAYLSILNFGWGNALIRFLSELRMRKEETKARELITVIKIMNTLAIFVAIIVGIIVYFNIPMAFSKSLTVQELKLAQNIFIILAGSVIATIANDYYVSFSYVYEKFIFAKTLELAKYLVRMLLLITIISRWNSAIYVAIVDFVISQGVLALNIYFCRNCLKIGKMSRLNRDKFQFSNYYDVAKYAMLFFFNLVIEQLIWNTDSIIIGMRLNTQEVAIFSSGATISAAFYSMTLVINNMLFPRIVKEVTVQQKLDASDTMIKVGRIQAFIAMFIFTGYYVFGNQFVCNIWLGQEYQKAWVTSIIVMLGTLFSSLASSGHLFLRAINKQGFFLTSYFFIFLVNAVFTYILVGKYGIVAAALTTTTSYIVGMCFFIMPYYKRVIGLKIWKFLKNILPIIISTMGIGVLFSRILVRKNMESIWNMIFYIIIFAFCYCLLVTVILLNHEEREIIKTFIEKIKE